MLKIVDNDLIEQTLPYIYELIQMPPDMYRQVYHSLTNLHLKLTNHITINKRRRRLLQAQIYGTVSSGHPTRTTFGNTLRVIHYYKFILHEANIDKYHMYVGGDDFFI